MRFRSFSIHGGLLAAALLGPALFLALPSPAHADLRVTGKSRHAALWQRIYDRLPPGWKAEETVLVMEATDAELNPDSALEEPDDSYNSPGEDQDGSIDGDYKDDGDAPPTIRLSNTLDDRESGYVFAHEYGHFVWEEKLTRWQRRSYRRLWWQQRQAGHLVSEYAEEDPDEGFAEAFAYFLQKPDQLRHRDAASWRFLRKLEQEAGDSRPTAEPEH